MKVRRKRKRVSAPPPEDKGQRNLALDLFLDKPIEPKRKATKKKSSFELAILSAKARSQSGDWEDAKPRVFVGLYAVCHELIYGIVPEELKPDVEMRKATRIAAKCMKTSFDDDPIEMVHFVKWTWERQKQKEAWAMGQGRNLSRLSPWAQFSASMVTDYRKAMIDAERRKKRRG